MKFLLNHRQAEYCSGKDIDATVVVTGCDNVEDVCAAFNEITIGYRSSINSVVECTEEDALNKPAISLGYILRRIKGDE